MTPRWEARPIFHLPCSVSADARIRRLRNPTRAVSQVPARTDVSLLGNALEHGLGRIARSQHFHR